MNKHARRAMIKSLYPRACQGDQAAVRALANLMKDRMPPGHCEICGTPVIGRRCMLHLRRRVYMRHQLASP